MRVDAAEADPERWWATVERAVERSASVAQAAQTFAESFYEYYVDSTVLVRVFGTVPLAELDDPTRAFAAGSAARAGEPPLGGATPVLTLLGTRGVEPAWNAVRLSRGHRAVPLVSAGFVAGIPMIARLLAEIGFGPLEPARPGSQYVKRSADETSGLFFVGDARTTTDERGRLIIPAVGFVERYRVKTVFGFGGFDAGCGAFLSVIVFCCHALMRPDAARFVRLVELLMASTSAHWERRAIFAPAG